MSKKTPAMFDDVRQILDAALSAGGGTVTLKTHGEAVHWRHRAYTFRKVYRESISPKASAYDRLTFRKIESDSCDVEIAVMRQDALFKPKSGGTPVVAPPSPRNEVEDELLEEARALSKKFGIEL